jgi:hypothetical protein
MKITKTKLKQIIKEELKENFTDAATELEKKQVTQATKAMQR